MEDTFDLKKFLVENKLTNNSRILEVDNEERAFDAEFAQAANAIAGAIGAELKNKDPKQLDEAVIGATITAILTANTVVGFISKYSAKLSKTFCGHRFDASTNAS